MRFGVYSIRDAVSYLRGDGITIPLFLTKMSGFARTCYVTTKERLHRTHTNSHSLITKGNRSLGANSHPNQNICSWSSIPTRFCDSRDRIQHGGRLDDAIRDGNKLAGKDVSGQTTTRMWLDVVIFPPETQAAMKPRQNWMVRGRVRVTIPYEFGSPTNCSAIYVAALRTSNVYIKIVCS